MTTGVVHSGEYIIGHPSCGCSPIITSVHNYTRAIHAHAFLFLGIQRIVRVAVPLIYERQKPRACLGIGSQSKRCPKRYKRCNGLLSTPEDIEVIRGSTGSASDMCYSRPEETGAVRSRVGLCKRLILHRAS